MGDPESICILLNVCPKTEVEPVALDLPAAVSYDVISESDISESEVDLASNPLECDLCKFIVDYLDKKLVNNRSEAAINTTITELCDKLPGELNTLCTSLKPDLIKALEDEFLPDKICKVIRACTAAGAKSKAKSLITCQTCQDVLTKIVGTETSIEICSQIGGVCGKTKTNHDSSSYHDNEIVSESEEMVSGPAECTLCKFIVNEIDVLIGANKTKENVNASLQKICNSLAGELQGLCETFAPILYTAIENGLDPNMLCTKLKLCQGEEEQVYEPKEKIINVYEPEEGSDEPRQFDEYELIDTVMKKADKEEKDKLEEYPMCVLCKSLSQEIDFEDLKMKSTEEINDELYSICEKFVSPEDLLCKTFIPIIIKGIKGGFEPSEVCETIKLCPNQSVALHSDELVSFKEGYEKSGIEDGPGCALCKFLIEEIDIYIGQNKSAAEINATVYELCSKLPAPFNSLCQTYAPIIVKDVAAGFDPEKTCEKVKLCSNGSLSIEELLPLFLSEQEKNDKETPGCTICKFLIQEIDAYLGQNQSAAQINASVYTLCSKLPAPINSLCTTYAPVIVSDVIAGFDPKKTCEKVKLCTSNVFTDKLEAAKYEDQIEKSLKDSLGCSVCKFIIQEIDGYLAQNQTAAQLNASVYGLCNKLPGALTALCKTFAPVIVQDVIAGFDPAQSCNKLKVCINGTDLFSKEFQSQYFEKKLKDSLGCSVCKFIIQEIDGYLAQNQTAAQLNASVYGLCNKLPGALTALCKTFAPVIVQDVIAGFDPAQSCNKLKVCINGTDLFSKEFQSQYFEKKLKDSLGCSVCKFIIQEIDGYLAQNQTAAQLNASVYGLCNKLPGALTALCKTFAPVIVQDVIAGFDPAQSCNKLKVCTNGTDLFSKHPIKQLLEENIKESPGCTICKFLIQEIDAYLGQNQSAAQINASVYTLCSKLPAPISTLCTTYAPIIVKDVIAGFDPKKTCEKVKLCTSGKDLFSKQPFTQFIEENIEETPGCTICKFLIQEIDAYLGQNQSATQINASVYTLCSKLPAPFGTLCTTYAPIIVKDVIAGFDPKKTCEKVKLCTNGTDLFSEELKEQFVEEEEQIKDGPLCAICQLLVQEIDSYIAQNKTAAQINDTVYALCAKFPAPLGTLCQTYAPIIVKDVLAGFDPKMTCEKVKMCTNGTESFAEELKPQIIEEEVKAGPLCAICELLVQEIDSYIAQNKTAAQINDTVYALCAKFPAPLGTLCQTYAPIIVKDVLAGFDPEMTCTKVKLCTNGSLVEPFVKETEPNHSVEVNGSEEKVTVDPLCGLCEFVVQLVDQYLEENKTLAVVNNTLRQICNLFPANIKAPCLLFAPQIVNMIAGGVTPELACKAVKMCPATSGKFFHREIVGLPCGQCHGIVELFLPKKYTPEFGNKMCRGACPVSRSRRSAAHFNKDIIQFQKGEKLDQSWRCDLCEFVIKAIDAYVQTNSSEQQIEDYMKDICNFMPEPFKTQCLKTVPDIIRELSHGFDQNTLCQHYMPDECKNDSEPMVSHKVMEIFKDKNNKDCDLCVTIIKTIDSQLNHDKNEVQLYVNDVCDRLPSPTNKACKTYAAGQLEEILMKIIDKLLTPEDICHMIKVC